MLKTLRLENLDPLAPRIPEPFSLICERKTNGNIRY